MSKKDWSHETGFLSRIQADELYARLVDLPWVETELRFGLSYGRCGINSGETTEIPSFLTAVANRVTAKTQVPVNYIQIHRFGPEHDVHPHADPSGMTVPMVTVGQERTFRVSGTMPDQYWRMPQSQRSVEAHTPEDEYLLRHGDLLIFNGGRTLHSMFPATLKQDPRFNRNGYDWRFSVLFRWTTPAMRKFGVGVCNQHGQAEEYAAAVKEFQDQQQKSLF